MTLVPMRFKNYEWRYNPEEISFECEKTYRSLTHRKTRHIFRTSAEKQAYKRKGSALRSGLPRAVCKFVESFEEGGVGVLALPFIKPVYAVFENLR